MLQKLRKERLNGRGHCSVLLDVAPRLREINIMIFCKSSSKETFDHLQECQWSGGDNPQYML